MDLDALIRSHHDELTSRLSFALSGDRHTAEDLAQEAFARAWRRLPEGLSPERQRAWLRRTSRNLAVDELRRRARRPTVALEDADAAGRHAPGRGGARRRPRGAGGPPRPPALRAAAALRGGLHPRRDRSAARHLRGGGAQARVARPGGLRARLPPGARGQHAAGPARLPRRSDPALRALAAGRRRARAPPHQVAFAAGAVPGRRPGAHRSLHRPARRPLRRGTADRRAASPTSTATSWTSPL